MLRPLSPNGAVGSLYHERSLTLAPAPARTSASLCSTMASTPPPVIGKAGNLTVFITPPATPPPVDTPTSRSAESPGSEFSTPNSTPRSVASPASPPPEHTATSPPPVKTVSPPPPVKTVSPPLPPAKLFQAPPVQVPPPQFEKAEARTDGSALAFFWDAVLRVQEAHASLDEYISNWFGLDQSKYQWALNDYYESTGKEMDSGKAAKTTELSGKMEKV